MEFASKAFPIVQEIESAEVETLQAICECLNRRGIKNREGRVIGIVNGEWLMDGHSKLIARYIRSSDIIVTRDGRFVGKGDQRLRVLSRTK